MKKTGLFIILIGLVVTIFTTLSFTTRKKVVDIGKMEITAPKGHHFEWSPLIGVAVMAIGGVFIWQAPKKA
jgi:hypothetical protein